MQMAMAIMAGVVVGGFLGYMLGYFVACEILDAGNLCGLFGVFLTGPLGAIAGGVGGAFVSRRHRSPPA